jgi:hypothetical protein
VRSKVRHGAEVIVSDCLNFAESESAESGQKNRIFEYPTKRKTLFSQEREGLTDLEAFRDAILTDRAP